MIGVDVSTESLLLRIAEVIECADGCPIRQNVT
jgi:hypothetical protein